jgi:hypothetical protein
MDVNQKYCQNCHLISRVIIIREYAERFSERFHPGPRQFINLV